MAGARTVECGMALYGLTGSIGAGKSTVARMFSEMGIPVADADALGRKLLASPGEVADRLKAVVPGCVGSNGGIDRGVLASVIFENERIRREVELLLHAEIWRMVQQWLGGLPRGRPALIEGAVLLESPLGLASGLCGIVMVVAPGELRFERVLSRGDIDPEQFRLREAAQLAQSEKLCRADFVIDNSADPASTRRQVEYVAGCILREWGGELQ
ncbi:MAG: dephospho-CoA kinase [Deltaproteobacteria bacterium]|nr:MAG: dephospho-CoA kinase [Deltaproteobacteria bacterium]